VPLEKLLTTEHVKFEVTEGDVTSDYSGKNVAAKIGDCIKRHCDEYKYKIEDFAEAILLVDMDGAYIDAKSILQNDDYDSPYYSSDRILHSRPEKLIKTHSIKQLNLNTMLYAGMLI
jgi:hypothetical protein